MATCAYLFERYGERLPLRPTDRDQKLFWFHCTTLIDALDESRTLAKRFPDGRLYMFERLWFHADRLRDAVLFKVPQAGACLLCTDTFKQHIESLGLTGLIFWLNGATNLPAANRSANGNRWPTKAACRRDPCRDRYPSTVGFNLQVAHVSAEAKLTHAR